VDRPFESFRHNVYSQNGEDGIIVEILRRFASAGVNLAGMCVEFGAWDGKYLSNTFNLVEQSLTRVVCIECDPEKYKDLEATARMHPAVMPVCARIGTEPGERLLDDVLAEQRMPTDFDILSIDIDSYDFQVFHSLTRYRPKIVIVEVESSFPPGVFLIHSPPQVQGSSFSAMLALGITKGYRLVCHVGNMIFVRDDLFDAIALPVIFQKMPELLFDPAWLKHSDLGNVDRERRFLPGTALVGRWLSSLKRFHLWINCRPRLEQ
jgi:hypothetical protein